MTRASVQNPRESTEIVSLASVNQTTDLSVIIITRNEEHDIEDCLRSVQGLAKEIIVVDSGSKDRTLEICQRYTDKIFKRNWTGYSDQKQFALKQARGPWVLNIDADERVSNSLKIETQNLLEANKEKAAMNGYHIPFQHFFLGRRLRFGGVQGESHIRLFRKGEAGYGQDPVHEGIKVTGLIGHTKSPIYHYSYRSIKDYLEKCNEYTSIIAEKRYQEGARFRFWHHLRLPYEFVVRYGLRLGFLDGRLGLVYALLSSYYVWLKFMKLLDFEKKEQQS